MPSGMSRAEDAQHPEPGSVPPQAGRGDSHRWLQVYKRPRLMGAFLYWAPPMESNPRGRDMPSGM